MSWSSSFDPSPQGIPKGACWKLWDQGVCPNGNGCSYKHLLRPASDRAPSKICPRAWAGKECKDANCSKRHASREDLQSEYDNGTNPQADSSGQAMSYSYAPSGRDRAPALSSSGSRFDFEPPARGEHGQGGRLGQGDALPSRVELQDTNPAHRPSEVHRIGTAGPPRGTCLNFWWRASCGNGPNCAYIHDLPAETDLCPEGVCQQAYQGKRCGLGNACSLIHKTRRELLEACTGQLADKALSQPPPPKVAVSRPPPSSVVQDSGPVKKVNPPRGTCLSFWDRATCDKGAGCQWTHNLPPEMAQCPKGVCEKIWRGKKCAVSNCLYIHKTRKELLEECKGKLASDAFIVPNDLPSSSPAAARPAAANGTFSSPVVGRAANGSGGPSTRASPAANDGIKRVNPPSGTCLSFWDRATCDKGAGCQWTHNLPPETAQCPKGVCEKIWRGKKCAVSNCLYIHKTRKELLEECKGKLASDALPCALSSSSALIHQEASCLALHMPTPSSSTAANRPAQIETELKIIHPPLGICINFWGKAHCDKGADCRYPHDLPPETAQCPKGFCQHAYQGKLCPRGSACKFAHRSRTQLLLEKCKGRLAASALPPSLARASGCQVKASEVNAVRDLEPRGGAREAESVHNEPCDENFGVADEEAEDEDEDQHVDCAQPEIEEGVAGEAASGGGMEEEEEEEAEEREEDQQLRNQANLLVAWCLQRWPGSSDIEPLASWVYSLSKGVKRVVDQEDGERVLGVCKGVVRTLLSGGAGLETLYKWEVWGLDQVQKENDAFTVDLRAGQRDSGGGEDDDEDEDSVNGMVHEDDKRMKTNTALVIGRFDSFGKVTKGDGVLYLEDNTALLPVAVSSNLDLVELADQIVLLCGFSFVPCQPGVAPGFWHSIKVPSGSRQNHHYLEIDDAQVVGVCSQPRYPPRPALEGVIPVTTGNAFKRGKAASKKKRGIDIQGTVLTLSPIFRIPSPGGKVSYYFILELGPADVSEGGVEQGGDAVTVVFQGEAEMAWYPFVSVGGEVLITCLRSTVLDHGKPTAFPALRCTRMGEHEPCTVVINPVGGRAASTGGGGRGALSQFSQLSQRMVKAGDLQGYTQSQVDHKSARDDKEVVDYVGVITDVVGDGIYELDSSVMVLCTHVALPGYGRGLRVGAEVHFFHLVPVMLRGAFVSFGCGVFSSVRVLSFSALDTPYRFMGRELSLFRRLSTQTSLPDFVQVLGLVKSLSAKFGSVITTPMLLRESKSGDKDQDSILERILRYSGCRDRIVKREYKAEFLTFLRSREHRELGISTMHVPLMPTINDLRDAGKDLAEQRLKHVGGWRYAVEEKGDAQRLGLSSPLNTRIANVMGVAPGRSIAVLGVLAGEGGRTVLRDDSGDMTVVAGGSLRASIDDFVFIWGFALCCERGGGAASSVCIQALGGGRGGGPAAKRLLQYRPASQEGVVAAFVTHLHPMRSGGKGFHLEVWVRGDGGDNGDVPRGWVPAGIEVCGTATQFWAGTLPGRAYIITGLELGREGKGYRLKGESARMMLYREVCSGEGGCKCPASDAVEGCRCGGQGKVAIEPGELEMLKRAWGKSEPTYTVSELLTEVPVSSFAFSLPSIRCLLIDREWVERDGRVILGCVDAAAETETPICCGRVDIYVDPSRYTMPAGVLPGCILVLRRVEAKLSSAGKTYMTAVACTHMAVERPAMVGWTYEFVASRLDSSRRVLRGLGHEDATIQIGNLDPYHPNTSSIVRINCTSTTLLDVVVKSQCPKCKGILRGTSAGSGECFKPTCLMWEGGRQSSRRPQVVCIATMFVDDSTGRASVEVEGLEPVLCNMFGASVETARMLEQAALNVGCIRHMPAHSGPYQRPPEMDAMPNKIVREHQEATQILSAVVQSCCDSGRLAWLEMDCRHMPLGLKDQAYAQKRRKLFLGSLDAKEERIFTYIDERPRPRLGAVAVRRADTMTRAYRLLGRGACGAGA